MFRLFDVTISPITHTQCWYVIMLSPRESRRCSN